MNALYRHLVRFLVAAGIAMIGILAVGAGTASAASAVTVAKGCDYDGVNKAITYGSSPVARVTGGLSSCKYTVYVGGVAKCSYISPRLIQATTSYFDNRLYLQRAGSGWRLISLQGPRWAAGSWCAGQYVSVTAVYGSDLKLDRSWARDAYASPRVTLTVSSRQSIPENYSQVVYWGSWMFWT